MPELIVKLSKELARIVSTIETTLVQEVSMVTEEEQSWADVSPEELAPLFRRAVVLLIAFDSAVKIVVEEIELLARSAVRRKRMESIQVALGAYDFEKCLSLFLVWAQEEGINLEE
ncbi:MAG: hypothetical protein HQL74_13255 [Magnetococcales bacterium]|nr:hypothetical protein [Magnetococcales bacterium]